MSEDVLQKVNALRERVSQTTRAQENAAAQLRRLQSECSHQWGESIYDPIVTRGYRFEGDPPGTMGIDRRLPCYISGSETPRWKRTCQKCDLTEFTQRTKEFVTKNPVF